MKFKSKFSRVSVQIFLMFVALTCIFPIVWMVSTSLKSKSEVYTNMSLIPKVFHFDNYAIAWKDGLSEYFLNSVYYVIVVVTAVVVITTMAAYAFAKLKFPFKKYILFVIITSILVPVPGSFVPVYVLLTKIGLQNTRTGYMLPLIAGGIAVAIFILKAFFEGIPNEIEESAKIDGCSKFRIYWQIILPLSIPAISTIVIFNTLGVWNEFLLATVILTNDKLMPIQQGIYVFVGQRFTQYELYMASTFIATVPIIALYIMLNRQVLKGVTAGAIKG